MLIDRFEDKKIDGHLREKFSVGLTGLPYSEKMRLDRIIGFHYSAIGQSHFGSVIDIVLGSFRFAVNAHTRQEQGKLPTAKTMLGLIAPLFFSEHPKGLISEISLFFSPKVIKAAKYRTRYEQLKGFLSENAIVAEQPITGERLY